MGWPSRVAPCYLAVYLPPVASVSLHLMCSRYLNDQLSAIISSKPSGLRLIVSGFLSSGKSAMKEFCAARNDAGVVKPRAPSCKRILLRGLPSFLGGSLQGVMTGSVFGYSGLRADGVLV